MKKVYLENLSKSELMELVRNNNDLRELLENDFIDTEMDFIGDVLSTLKLKNYDIGFYNRNYVELFGDIEQLENIKRATDDFGLLSDESIEIVDYCIELINRRENMDWDNKQIDNIENKIGNLFGEIEDLILGSLNMMTDYTIIDDDILLDRLECLLDWNEEKYYIKENDKNKYTIYKDVVQVLL